MSSFVNALPRVRIALVTFILIDFHCESFSLRSEFGFSTSSNSFAPPLSHESESSTQFQNTDRIGFENLKFYDVVQDDDNETVFRFDKYPRTTEIYNLMDHLHQKHEDLVEIFDIGQTWENRTIRTMKISTKNPNNTAIWIDGGIHAREWISITSVCFIMLTVLKNWHDFDSVFRNTDFYFTPVLNPDGYEFSHGKLTRLWRKNRRRIAFCYGVDLNRNFPFKWGSSHYSGHVYGRKHCGEEFPGTAPLSEPETRAVTDFISQRSHTFKNKWQEREQQLIEESQKLKKELSSISIQRVEILQTKLNTANEMINRLNDNLKKAADEWKKRETKLVEECNHLKYQIQSTPKTLSPDVERLQEQLKDAQEMNLKLKFDYDSYKDKCTALEHLCGDLKKVIMDEHIAEKLYANDNIPATVKQFLSSSSSSVINTLSHVFGCLSKSSSKNRFHSAQRDGSLRRELFTTNESLMINDLSRNYEQNEIIKELIKEKEQLKKENMDLNRQVKELEQIVRRRAHPNFSHVSEIMKGNNESKQHEQESEIVKNLKKELLDKQYLVIDLKNQLVELKAKHDQSLLNLQGKVVNIQEESIKLKEELDKKKNVVVVTHGPKCKRRGRTCDPPTPSARNFRTELTAKDREIQTLNKQLEELKKTNRKLAKEKGQCVLYLSSKEQSADDIHTSRKQASGINSEIGSPDKTFTDFLKNSNLEIQKNYDGVDSDKYQNLRNIDDTNKMKMVSFDNNKNDLVKPVQNPSETASLGHNNANDYKVLSDKLNYLEGKHQNLQQITCNLLTLLTKEKQPGKEIDSLQHHEELHQFVTMLKDFSV